MNKSVSTDVNPLFRISNFLSIESQDEIIKEIYTGLTAEKKYISSRYFYDDYGSTLFEKITTLPEYYPTRNEKSILDINKYSIVKDIENMDIIEMGSGDCSKISILFDTIPENKRSGIVYMPVDVSEATIVKSAGKLQLKFPGLRIHGLLADFMKHLTLPDNRKRLICFFGSTLGNLTRSEANIFLLDLKTLMNPGDTLLLGLDMVKDMQVLLDAYNDKEGVTALFNKNVLNVINDTVGTDFNSLDFEHQTIYNEQNTRIEMHLKANRDMIITSDFFKEKINIKEGETIQTENSHKYTFEDIKDFSTFSGLKIEKIYTDDNEWFSIVKFIRR